MADNEEITLPKATVGKILTEILPNDTSFTKEAREALVECCIEFIMIVTTESNEIAEKDCKKTISTDHIIKAVEELGFPQYLPILETYVENCKNNSKAKASRKEDKFKKSGMTEEELLAIQQQLFMNSRNKLKEGGE
ncbi:negative cofactor 2 transcription regulator complex subunit [Martiniozyma asiatica (nom. inval.)]|nr:negative cofactor 2 transcription regulator complex subunit [Martiniozyma asiatica]